MSRHTEDLLGSALQARAESVVGEDLRPFEVPEPAPRRRRTLVWAVAAAALAGVLAAPFVTGSDPPPRPPAPDPPDGAVRMDVDGDGAPDLTWVSFDAAAHTWLLSADLADGPTATYQGLAQAPPQVVGQADLDGDFAAEVIVRVSGNSTRLPEFFRLADGRLVHLDTPGSGEQVHGWSADAPGNQFTVIRGRLYTWRLDPGADQDLRRVPFWSWQVRGAALLPGAAQVRCVSDANPLPFECSLIPAGQTLQTTADLDGDGAPDDVRLTFTATDTAGAVDGFRVEADLSTGGTVETQGPAGPRPTLLNPLSLAGDERQQVLVQQSRGGSTSLSLFGLGESRLVLLDPPGRPELGSGTDEQGRAFRWLAAPGRLVTITTPEGGSRQVEGFEWTVRGTSLVATPLRGQCLPGGDGYLPRPC